MAGRRRGKRSYDPRKAFPGQKFSFYISKEEEHPYFRKGERESFLIQPYRAAADAGIKSFFFLLSPLSDIYTKMPPMEVSLFSQWKGIMSSRVGFGLYFLRRLSFRFGAVFPFYLIFFCSPAMKGRSERGRVAISGSSSSQLLLWVEQEKIEPLFSQEK